MTTKHSVQRHPADIDGWYLYRGVTIKRNDRERGYWGHWTASMGSIMGGTQKKFSTDTRAKILAAIDAALDKAA